MTRVRPFVAFVAPDGWGNPRPAELRGEFLSRGIEVGFRLSLRRDSRSDLDPNGPFLVSSGAGVIEPLGEYYNGLAAPVEFSRLSRGWSDERFLKVVTGAYSRLIQRAGRAGPISALVDRTHWMRRRVSGNWPDPAPAHRFWQLVGYYGRENLDDRFRARLQVELERADLPEMPRFARYMGTRPISLEVEEQLAETFTPDVVRRMKAVLDRVFHERVGRAQEQHGRLAELPPELLALPGDVLR
jgi:hypothetical protein